MATLTAGDKCEHPDCAELAVRVVAPRDGYPPLPAVAKLCNPHAEKAVDRQYPEYHVHCPACGVEFGVN